jgi:hypothetical protein
MFFPYLGQELLYLMSRQGIESAKGLVQRKNSRPIGERTGNDRPVVSCRQEVRPDSDGRNAVA